jgi:hypothetical protein
MKKLLPIVVAALVLIATQAFGATAYRYNDSVTTLRGDAVGGASVTVYLAGTTTKASLYFYNTSAGTAKANPTYTDGYGRYYFYVLPGTYDITISGTNITTYTVEDVRVFSDAGYTYPVEYYGAVANDGVDDTAAIQAAITAAGAARGTVEFAGGSYSISSTLTVSGDYTTIRGPAVIVRAGSWTSASAMLKINAAEGVIISDVSVDGNDSTAVYVPTSVRIGIQVAPGSENTAINGVDVYNVHGDGIYVGATGAAPISTRITNCYITGNRRNGISVTNGSDVLVSGCTVADNYQNAIDVEPNGASDVANGVVVSSNHLSVSLTHAMDSGLTYYPRLLDASTINENISSIVVSGNTFKKLAASTADTSALHDVAVFISGPEMVTYSGNSVSTNYTSTSMSYGLVTIRDYESLAGFGNTIRSDSQDADGHNWGTYKLLYLGFTAADSAVVNTSFQASMSGNAYAGLYGVHLNGGNINISTSPELSYGFSLQLCSETMVVDDGSPIIAPMSAAPDTLSARGRLWYDAGNDKLQIYGGAAWSSLPVVRLSASAPTDTAGRRGALFWLDPSGGDTLKVYTGTPDWRWKALH